jgi:hypothetical protein
MAGAGMHDDTGRLVHHEQMRVLVGNAERNLLALDRRRPLRRKLDLELLAALEAVALGPPAAVDVDRSRLDEALGR